MPDLTLKSVYFAPAMYLSTVEIHLPELIGTASHPVMKKIRRVGFFLKIGYNDSLKWKKFSTNGYFRLHIY
jgi:hypothetical protein